MSTYNPRSANPFAQNEPNKEWSSNNLILQDATLRAKAGVTVLDSDVSDIFNGTAQSGGSATGAPFYMQNFGASNAKRYPEVPVTHELVPGQTGGGFPRHFYDNSKKW
jgi:hypothetical protein